MNGERRKLGTNLLITGIVLFLIGVYSEFISDWVYERDSNIRIFGWGWILQLAGGLIAIYGFMIRLEEYLATSRASPHPDMHWQYPPPHLFFRDRETKKAIWLLLIAALIIFILSPELQLQTLVITMLFLLVLFLIFRREQRPYYPYPFPYYPPPQPPYQPKSKEPSAPSQSVKVKLCEHCYSQLELGWVACPFCGQSISTKPANKNEL